MSAAHAIHATFLQGRRLNDIADIVMGQSPPGNTYNEQCVGLPFFQGKAEFGETSPTAVKWCSSQTRIAEAGDILISVRAPVGPTNVAAEKCCIGRGLAAIRPDSNKLDKDYLLYFFKYVEPSLSGRGQGSTFSAINKKDLHELLVPVPPLSEQRRIVDILKRADGIRRLRKQAQDTARQLIQALFIDMFGEPAMNPMNWPVGVIGDVLTKVQYGTSKKAHEEGDGMPVIRMGNVRTDGELVLQDLKYVMLDEVEREKYRLEEGDILFNRTNSKDLVGKTGMWRGDFDAVAASYFIVGRTDRNRVLPAYLWAYMNMQYMKRRLFDTARGAIGQSNINAKELKAFSVPLPPIDLQELFDIRLNVIHSILGQQEVAQNRAESCFQSILYRAFNG